MPRQLCTKDYVQSLPVLFENFENTGDWSAGSGTFASNTSWKTTGSQSIQLTSDGTNIARITKTISADMSNTGTVCLDVYINDVGTTPPSQVQFIKVYLSNDAAFTNYYLFSINTGNLRAGYNRLQIGTNDWTAVGSPSWSTNMIRLRVRADAYAGQTAVVSFDNMTTNSYSRPKLVICFDDFFAPTVSVGKAYMDIYGFRGSVFAAKNLVGSTSTYGTLADMHTLYDGGWDVHNHSTTHPHVDTLTQAQVQTELQTCNTWLVSNGFTRNNCNMFFAYPYGTYSATASAELQSEGYVGVRTILHYTNPNPIDQNQFLYSFTTNYGTYTLNDFKNYIQFAINRGSTVMVLFHNLTNTPSGVNDCAISDFQAFIDYVHTFISQIDVVTLTEWYYKLYTRPVIGTIRQSVIGRGVVAFRPLIV